MEGESVHAVCGLCEIFPFGTQKMLVEHHGELWNSGQYIYKGFEYAVIDVCEISDWFKIKLGVKQGYVTSGL